MGSFMTKMDESIMSASDSVASIKGSFEVLAILREAVSKYKSSGQVKHTLALGLHTVNHTIF